MTEVVRLRCNITELGCEVGRLVNMPRELDSFQNPQLQPQLTTRSRGWQLGTAKTKTAWRIRHASLHCVARSWASDC